MFTVVYVRESPRWLLEQGRNEEARSVIAWLTMRDESELSLEAEIEPERKAGYRELLRYRQSALVTALAWIGASAAVAGVFLWGPTFLEEILEVDSDEAAGAVRDRDPGRVRRPALLLVLPPPRRAGGRAGS